MPKLVQFRSCGETAQKAKISQMSIYLRFFEDAGMHSSNSVKVQSPVCEKNLTLGL